jgi:hypothetical protein
MTKSSVMPNFLIIGASKGGTTSLNFVLAQHPEIYMCPVKEAGFFWAYPTLQSGQAIHLQGPGADKLRGRLVADLDKYQALFENAARRGTGSAPYKAFGESSVRYLTHPHAPHCIHQFIPNARLLISLRQPADRAYSAFMHNLRDGLEPSHNFADALAQERQGLRDDWIFCRYLDRGLYAQALKRYFEFFDRSQFHISFLEDLKADPAGLYRRIFRFLEVDQAFQPDTSGAHNASGIIRNPLLRALWTRSNRLRSAIRPLLDSRVRHAAFEWVIRDLEKPAFSPELRADLTEYYRTDIEQLQDLLQYDLSHWLEPARDVNIPDVNIPDGCIQPEPLPSKTAKP